MAKMIFNIDRTDYREAFNIELTVPDDMTIYEYKVVCERMASAMGYTNSSIKKAFGENDYESTEDVQFKKLLKNILSSTTGSLQRI